MKVPRHYAVEYDDPSHIYSYQKQRYTSATQLIERFSNHFDVEKEAIGMAERHGHTPEYWKQKWAEKNGRSKIRGTVIHNAQELRLYRQKFIEWNPSRLPVLKYSTHVPYSHLEDGVYPEMLLWHHEYRIAGRMDKGILFTDKGDRIASVEDFKTNEKLVWESFEHHKTGYRMMTGPLSHLMDSNMIHYSLQLSIYQYLLEYHGFLPGTRTIIHYAHEIEGLGTPDPVRYELQYLRDEVIAMMEYNLNNPL